MSRLPSPFLRVVPLATMVAEGVHGRVPSGFVELIIDNTSRRLCMFDADSVIIRRSFSLDADDITIQGNTISGRSSRSSSSSSSSRSSSSSSSSSSRSSFIIHQGRIQEVSLLTSVGRLSLLAAGCCNFIEEKAKETELLLQHGLVYAEEELEKKLRPEYAAAVSVYSAAQQQHAQLQELKEEADTEGNKAAAAAADAAAAAKTMEEASTEIAKLKTPLEEIVEEVRQQQAVLSSLLQQRTAAAADVEAEYINAIEAIGGFCLFQFVVEDAATALEAIARLKQQQQQQQQQQQKQQKQQQQQENGGLLLQRRCCISIVPLKEVMQQQQQQQQKRQQRLQQMQQQAQQLLDEGAAMPLTDCIEILQQEAGAHAAAIEVYIHSIFNFSLLVPSIHSQEVNILNNIDLSGCVSFANGVIRGGGNKYNKLTSFFSLRNALKKEKEINKNHEQQQQTLAALQQRAALSLAAAIKEEEQTIATRTAARKQLMQSLRHEALQAQQTPLTATEQQLLQQLPQQLQQQQQLLQQLLQRVEAAASAISEAEETLEVSLRRGVDRLEREAREEEGEGLGFRVCDRVDAEATALQKTRQQHEDTAAEIETAIRGLESKVAAAREQQAAADISLHAAAARLIEETSLLQQWQLEEEAKRRLQADLASLLAAASAAAGGGTAAGTAAAAATAAGAASSESREVLRSKLEAVKEELVEDPTDISVEYGGKPRGVEMQINFNAAAADNHEHLPVQRLSGGQKTVAAAALLLAQQLASSSSISSSSSSGGGEGLLLLDEPDAALDGQFAQRLSAALKTAAAELKCQVVLTTLRKELLSCGDKFWLVQQIERSSRPREITKEEAAELLLDLPQQQQQQQQQQLMLLPPTAMPEAVPSMG
ncbi:structural maintenance of chromosome domain-containing protein, putative [Eimeria maxima]|uniref:Structural maintenance of chromosome domain-containing protein, putative n=1 Tax=Eimeria maxima TaxID=5804 RepID=U6M0R8_EIMMA|nr:structural maintenance of chromosome domain-containing protein, putative [Eimeria maxima]CDJ57581.1 structural maintenance of chromosome domain-containing protein, putative [Eimeria maxima]